MTTELAGHLTNHEVTLAVPIGVVIAAGLALTGVWLTLRNARTLAREERLWEKQAALYMTIMKTARRVEQQLENFTEPPLSESDQQSFDTVTDAVFNDIESLSDEVQIFASINVIVGYDIFDANVASWCNQYWHPNPDKTYNDGAGIRIARRRLAERIRNDLRIIRQRTSAESAVTPPPSNIEKIQTSQKVIQ